MKRHILLIDDDEDEFEILRTALFKVPIEFECMWVQSPEHALQLLRSYVPDFIFIDYNMPKSNGLKCLAEIKKLKNVENTPVILYSNCIDEESSEKAKSMGAYTLEKPTLMNTLVKKLKELLMGK
jgi:DNA-binding NtrC family response regulator